jgi:hypothetical protein
MFKRTRFVLQFHHDKKFGVARAAGEFGTLYSLSTTSANSVANIVAVADGADELGKIGSGYFVDLIVQDKNPLANINVVERYITRRCRSLCTEGSFSATSSD